MKNFFYNFVLAFLFCLAALILILMLQSCSVTKSKSGKTTDTNHVVKTDSGQVKKNTHSEKNTAEWERQIVIYNRDTTINNYISTGGKPSVINVPQPRVIITERGSMQQEKQSINYDSIWQNKTDSLQLFIAESTKNKKETALNTWQIIGLCIGVSIVVLLLSKLKFSFK